MSFLNWCLIIIMLSITGRSTADNAFNGLKSHLQFQLQPFCYSLKSIPMRSCLLYFERYVSPWIFHLLNSVVHLHNSYSCSFQCHQNILFLPLSRDWDWGDPLYMYAWSRFLLFYQQVLRKIGGAQLCNLYDDDVILFAKGACPLVWMVYLNLFSQATGQSFNLSKSKLFFGRACSPRPLLSQVGHALSGNTPTFW